MYAMILSLAVLAQADPGASRDDAHGFAIKQAYDKFQDRTTLTLDFGEVRRDGDDVMAMRLYAVWPGTTRGEPPESVGMLLSAISDDGWEYLDYHPVVVLADDERFRYEPDHDGTVGDGYVGEQFIVILPLAMLRDVATAKSAEVALGNDNFALRADHQAAIREFLGYIDDPGGPIPRPIGRVVKIDDRGDLMLDVTLESGKRASVPAGFRVLLHASDVGDDSRETLTVTWMEGPMVGLKGAFTLPKGVTYDLSKNQSRPAPKAVAQPQDQVDDDPEAKAEADRRAERREATERRARFNRARVLEKPNPKAAAEAYRDLIERYPDSLEAGKARARLEALGGG